jgi:hypothetical protein
MKGRAILRSEALSSGERTVAPAGSPEVPKYPCCTGEAEQIVRDAISPNFGGNLWKFLEQAKSPSIKDIDSPAKRPLAQNVLKELGE